MNAKETMSRESVLQHRVGSGPPQPRRRPIGLEYARNEFDCVLDRFDERCFVHRSTPPLPILPVFTMMLRDTHQLLESAKTA